MKLWDRIQAEGLLETVGKLSEMILRDHLYIGDHPTLEAAASLRKDKCTHLFLCVFHDNKNKTSELPWEPTEINDNVGRLIDATPLTEPECDRLERLLCRGLEVESLDF